jgi:sec-independent protein translocase protein TatC
MKKNKNKNEMTAQQHMHELKMRIVACAVAIIAVFIISLTKYSTITKLIMSIGENAGFKFIYCAPQDAMLVAIKISMTIAIIATTPIIIMELVAFINPIFEKKKKIMIISTAIMATCLFFAGIAFAIYVILPMAIRFMYNAGQEIGISSEVAISQYMSLVVSIAISMGIVSELPIVCIMLNRAGILSINMMKKLQKVVAIISLIVSAIITPPDVVSQILVAVPLIVLYEASIVVCAICSRKRVKQTLSASMQ